MNIWIRTYNAIYHWVSTRHCDIVVIVPLLLIILISLTVQSSVAGGQFFPKHFIHFLLGLPIFYIGYSFRPDTLKKVTWYVYAIGLILLIWVTISGTSSLGAQRWITIGGFSMQPSEPAKIACILALAYWYSKHAPKGLLDLLKAGFAIMFIPFILIFSQPDLGTSMVLVALFALMSYWAGAHPIELIAIFNPIFTLILSAVGLDFALHLGQFSVGEHIISISSSYIGIIYLLLVNAAFWSFWHIKLDFTSRHFWYWLINAIAGVFMAFIARPFAWGILEPYQQKRLTIFLNPDTDPLGAGYNILQSLMAVGGGKFAGQGYHHGSLTQGNFVPEQHTDFVFSALSEEWGFIGVCILLACYLLISLRMLWFASRIKQPYEQLIVVGISTFFMFHAFVNTCMNIGLLPVTGVPLPLMSHGGTAIWIMLFSLGLVQGVYAKYKGNVFSGYL